MGEMFPIRNGLSPTLDHVCMNIIYTRLHANGGMEPHRNERTREYRNRLRKEYGADGTRLVSRLLFLRLALEAVITIRCTKPSARSQVHASCNVRNARAQDAIAHDSIATIWQ